ncbi:MAG: hypothetical protein U0269_02485 [Polyangiales bacterium]
MKRVFTIGAIVVAIATQTTDARAQSRPSFAVGNNSFVRGLFIDGDTLAIGGSTAGVHWRNGTISSLGSGGTQALCGRRVGDRLVIARAAFDGVVRSDGVNVASASAPLVDRERISACAVDSTGAVYFAGEHNAIYRWSGDDWSTLRLGAGVSVASLAVSTDDTLYVLASDGLLRRTGSAFDRVALGLESAPTGEATALWISERTHRAYIAWGASLFVLDLGSGAVRLHHHSMFGGCHAITGIAAPSGDLVALAAQSNVALFDGRAFTTLGRDYVFTRALAFDPPGGALYVGAQSEVGALSIDHPALRAYAATLPAPVVAAAPTMNDPVPTQRITVAPANASPPRSSQPSTSRNDPYTFIPTVRFGFGAAMGTGASRNLETGFSFDAIAGAFGYRERSSVQFLPELGVAYQGGPSPGGTYFRAGTSVLYGNLLFSGGLSAHALIGGSSAGFAAGLRTGVILQTLLTGITVDLGYQFLPTATDNRHAFVGTLSVNPIPLILGIWFASSFFRMRMS